MSVVTLPTDILAKFPDIFDNRLGELKDIYKLVIDPKVLPTVTPTRKVPYSLMKPLKIELDRMESEGVIIPVTTPTDWVNALLPVQKNNKLRIVLDPRPLNKALKREHYPIPTFDNMMSHFRDCNVFSVLDGKDAFWQMPLDGPSSFLCTFGTPFGRYRFLRVPFGISVAPEFQQRTMDNICLGLEGTVAFFDDIMVGGKDIHEHNDRLSKFLLKAREAGLKLKTEKTQLAKDKVTFVGHVISGTGIEPASKNVTAINSLKYPTSRKELQRFLGMFSFLSKFIPNLSDRTTYLRSLMKPTVSWSWSNQATKDFDDLKKSINDAPKLNYYDPKLPLKVSVDASQYGLGAVITQNNKPIEYASVTLTLTQRRYAQIEKEMLAIVFGCTRFHYYTYGREIDVETDHKPLLAILKKPLESVSPRLKRMILKLQSYIINLRYTPGKELYIADTLSRCPATNNINPNMDDEALLVHTLYFPEGYSEKHKLIRQGVLRDPICQKLIDYIENDWPERKNVMPPELRIYHKFRNELYLHEGLIYRDERILVPQALRVQMLDSIHETHQGMVASKPRAREHLFWPGQTRDIEEIVSKCHTCQKYLPSNTKETLLSTPIQKLPWERIAVDIFHLHGKAYLLMVDYYSKFVELKALGNCTNAVVVISALKSSFCTHGIPGCLMSDNGPPFDSLAFKQFAKTWNFKLLTSSPTYAQSNGQVERTIRTVKTQLKKCMETDSDPYLVPLNYNSTPHDKLPAPSVLLMQRKLKNTLPGHDNMYKPISSRPDIEQAQRDRKFKQELYYNRGAKNLEPFKINSPIYYQDSDGLWLPAIIIAETDQPRSYKIFTQTGTVLRRNRRHLRHRTSLVTFLKPDFETLPCLPFMSNPVVLADPGKLERDDKPAEGVNSENTLYSPKTPIKLYKGSPSVEPNQSITNGNTKQNNERITTRCGRVIKTPARLKT